MRLLPIKAPAPLRSASEVGARVQAGLLTGCLLATASSTRDRPRFTMAGAARGAGGLTYPGPAEGEAGREGAGRWAGSGRAGAEGRGRTGRGGAGQREGRLERGGAGSGRGRLRPERAAGPARRGWACARSWRRAPRGTQAGARAPRREPGLGRLHYLQALRDLITVSNLLGWASLKGLPVLETTTEYEVA